ncbi:hypothetical protein NX059_008337 [Plenodomus lindquistii]|nr:hypothetical protein NX059_008337 [Plenodomus lindquistii]
MDEKRKDFLWLLAPRGSNGSALDSAALATWESTMKGHRLLSDLIESGQFNPSSCGLISIPGDARKFMLNIERENYSTPSEVWVVWVNRFPKRRDFLHPVLGDASNRRAEPLPISECIVDNVPAWYSIFALLVPSIMHKVECEFIADELRTTVLLPLSIEPTTLPMIIKAFTSSSTDESEDYQNLEFLGDCVLKFIASLHLMAANLKEPESFLTQRKGRLVSNGSLARASVAAGLDQFVMTTRFTGAKWQPRLLTEALTSATTQSKRKLSSKLIADVIESSIGLAFVIGGFPKAFACVQTLLPLETWTPLFDANEILFKAAEVGSTITGLTMLESLVGYTFNKKPLLLDALTHASYLGPNANSSWERLEFLGDAVLDYLVTKRLYEHEPQLSHMTMHAIRTAMVNASYLAFRMFETTVNEDLVNKATMQSEVHPRALWQFMRSGAPQVTAAREVAYKQHKQARSQILAALESDIRYPWHLLALTDPPKFLSDIVESVLGAIYIDSHGDFAACEAFVHRLGILEDLRRILRDSVDCLHPKERLGHLAVEKDVKYAKIDAEEGDTACSKDTYRCQVIVGGVRVASPVEGLKRLNAETIAASIASRVLETTVDVSVCDTEEEDDFFDAEEGVTGGTSAN